MTNEQSGKELHSRSRAAPGVTEHLQPPNIPFRPSVQGLGRHCRKKLPVGGPEELEGYHGLVGGHLDKAFDLAARGGDQLLQQPHATPARDQTCRLSPTTAAVLAKSSHLQLRA